MVRSVLFAAGSGLSGVNDNIFNIGSVLSGMRVILSGSEAVLSISNDRLVGRREPGFNYLCCSIAKCRAFPVCSLKAMEESSVLHST